MYVVKCTPKMPPSQTVIVNSFMYLLVQKLPAMAVALTAANPNISYSWNGVHQFVELQPNAFNGPPIHAYLTILKSVVVPTNQNDDHHERVTIIDYPEIDVESINDLWAEIKKYDCQFVPYYDLTRSAEA